MGLLQNPQVRRLPFNGYWDSIPAVEQLVYAVNQSPLFIAKVNISEAIPLLCLYTFMAWPSSIFYLLWVQQRILKSTEYACTHI